MSKTARKDCNQYLVLGAEVSCKSAMREGRKFQGCKWDTVGRCPWHKISPRKENKGRKVKETEKYVEYVYD